MNKDKLEIDKNKVPFATRKSINLELNRDGCALVDTKWLIEENFERKEPTIENVMNSEFIYVTNKEFLYQRESNIICKCSVKSSIIQENEREFCQYQYEFRTMRRFSVYDYKKSWAFSPCDLEGGIWIH